MDPCSLENGFSRSGRQRLKPWLEAQVNNRRHPGLQWIDKEKRIFRMTWKHGGRADWSEEDGSIFKAWAIHTGRHREGIDEPDWPCWKTRLRCAINKQKPDIQEVKEMSCMDEPKPYRVFQFCDSRECRSNSPPQDGSPASVSDEVDAFSYHIQERPSVIQPSNGNIPTIISDSMESKPSLERQEETVEAQVISLGSDFQHVNIQDLVPDNNMSLTNISISTDLSITYNEVMDTDSLKGAGGQQAGQQVKVEPAENSDPAYLQSVSDHEMLVTLRFRSEVVHQTTITSPHGCRIFYGDLPFDQVWNPELFGSREAEQILVPYAPGHLRFPEQDQYTLTVLKGFEHGINLFTDNHSIYVERRCKTRIITLPANRGEKHTQKVGRNERLKVFDFAEDFWPAFQRYQEGEGLRPTPQVIIAIGQDFHSHVEPYSNLFFSVTVSHVQACNLLSQHSATSTTPEMSDSGQFDHCMDMLKKEKVTFPITSLNQVAAPEVVFEANLPLL